MILSLLRSFHAVVIRFEVFPQLPLQGQHIFRVNMTDRIIDLKNPWMAGVLAWLIPGAGHFYQQRHFKGALYLVCILGSYLFGLSLGEWRALYWTEPQGVELQERYSHQTRNYSFLTQLCAGTPGLWALFQSWRFYQPQNRPAYRNPQQLLQYLHFTVPDEERPQNPLPGSLPLEKPLETEFRGQWQTGNTRRTVQGQIRLEPFNRTFRGDFSGSAVSPDGKSQPLKIELSGEFFLDRPIVGDPHRRLVVKGTSTADKITGVLSGSVSRSVFNWFAAPQTPTVRSDLHFRLNKQFEVALVFTWIAGLLNILAIWDAVQGPAYGFGDEPPPEKQEQQSDEKETPSGKPKTEETAQQSQPAGSSAGDQPATPALAESSPASETGKAVLSPPSSPAGAKDAPSAEQQT